MVYGVLIHGDILFGLEDLYPSVIEDWDAQAGTAVEVFTPFVSSPIIKIWGDQAAGSAKVFSPFSSGSSESWSSLLPSDSEEWKRG